MGKRKLIQSRLQLLIFGIVIACNWFHLISVKKTPSKFLCKERERAWIMWYTMVYCTYTPHLNPQLSVPGLVSLLVRARIFCMVCFKLWWECLFVKSLECGFNFPPWPCLQSRLLLLNMLSMGGGGWGRVVRERLNLFF